MRKRVPVGGERPRGATGDRRACRWLLALYSEYRDDRLDRETRAAVVAHMGECDSCRRYDRVIRTGVAVLRDSFDADSGLAIDRPAPAVNRAAPSIDRAAPSINRDPMEDDGNDWRARQGADPSLSGIAVAAIVLAVAFNGVASWGSRIAPTPPRAEVAAEVGVAPGPTAAPVSFPLPPSPRPPSTGPEEDGSEPEVDPPLSPVSRATPADPD